MDRTQLAPAYRLISELFIYPEERDKNRIRTGRLMDQARRFDCVTWKSTLRLARSKRTLRQ